MSTKETYMKKHPNNDLSHLGKLWFDDGIKTGKKYKVGEKILFYPCADIDSFSISNNQKLFLRHVIYDIYECAFQVLAKYQGNDRPAGYYKFKDLNHYLLEILPGFNVFHFNFTKAYSDYLQIGTIYKGYVRLSICGNPASRNPNVNAKAIKRMRCKGVLEKIQPNLIMRDFSDSFNPKKQVIKRDTIYGDKGTISYIDSLNAIGYPEDELKFRVKVSEYKNKENLTLQNTDKNKNDDMLIFCIKML